MNTFADRVIAFNKSLDYKGILPEGIRIMNPFQEDENVLPVSDAFYKKYYNDNQERFIIIGINPGRFGGGVTGIPFTDSKRLVNECNLSYAGKTTHEPSSVFVYDVIKAYGSVEAFYKKFYITSLCPLGFTKTNERGKEINYNYYDSKALIDSVYNFILENLENQIMLGINRDICFCFGTGKNEKFLRKINAEHQFFKKIIPLEHPRFIMQYKNKEKQYYIDKYLREFDGVG